jgi:hypothetical protein
MDRIGIAIIPYNDIGLDETGNLAMARNTQAVGQHVRQRLSFYKGEWFLDADVGVDWFGLALGQRPARLDIAEAVIKKAILQTPGVTGIVEIQTDFDRVSRGMAVRKCVAETEYDDPAIIY